MKRALWILGLLCAALVAFRSTQLATTYRYADLDRAEAAASRGDWPAAIAAARTALARRPLDGRPYRILARAAAVHGDERASSRLLELALHYAPRDVPTRALALQRAVLDGNYAAAVRHADLIARVQPDRTPAVLPILSWLAVTEQGRAELATRLRDRPVWRSAMISYLVATVPRTDDLVAVMHLIGQSSALSPAEMSTYLERFVTARQWNDAYFAWLNELPAERRQQLASPIDGDFERAAATGSPFEWRLAPAKGVDARIVRRVDSDGHALKVTFAGSRVAFNGVAQLLLLQPGLEYRLRWQSRAESLITARGLSWELSCAEPPGMNLLTTDPLRGNVVWRQQESVFRVPANCPAQWLRLVLQARTPSEMTALGTAWFDQVVILSNVESP